MLERANRNLSHQFGRGTGRPWPVPLSAAVAQGCHKGCHTHYGPTIDLAALARHIPVCPPVMPGLPRGEGGSGGRSRFPRTWPHPKAGLRTVATGGQQPARTAASRTGSGTGTATASRPVSVRVRVHVRAPAHPRPRGTRSSHQRSTCPVLLRAQRRASRCRGHEQGGHWDVRHRLSRTGWTGRSCVSISGSLRPDWGGTATRWTTSPPDWQDCRTTFDQHHGRLSTEAPWHERKRCADGAASLLFPETVDTRVFSDMATYGHDN
jgi:hypothetical protein